MAVSRLQNLQGDLMSIAQQYNRTVACTAAYYEAHKNDPKATSPFPDGCFIYIKDDTQSVMNGFVNQMYPVGSVYMNALVQTDPNVLFNFGNWTRITGKFLYAASVSDTLLDTGGASTVTLTQANLPKSVTFTIPSLSLSIDSASTAHTHSFTTDATTDNKATFRFRETSLADDSAMGWIAQAVSGRCRTIPGGTSLTSTGSVTVGSGDNELEIDFNHNHDGNTNGMSANENHSHTGSTVAASKTISDFGSKTAFSIIPPFVKLAIWYRAS